MESSLMGIVFFLSTGCEDKDNDKLIFCMSADPDANIMQVGIEKLLSVVYHILTSYLDSYSHHR